MDIKTIYRKLHLLYFRYKDSPYFSISLYSGMIGIGVLLAIFVIIPQIQSFISLRQEISLMEEKIEILQKNSRFLTDLDKAQLEDDFRIVTTALPPERDVSLLITAITSAANNAGVALGDFSFQVGEVSSRSTRSRENDRSDAKISFTVSGTYPQIIQLIGELQRKLPLLAIEEIDAEFLRANSTQITVSYYSQALPLIPKNNDRLLTPVSPNNRVLIGELQGWHVPVFDPPPVSGSQSAVPEPF